MKPLHFFKFLRFTYKTTRYHFKTSRNNAIKNRFISTHIPKFIGASVGATKIVDLSDDLLKNNEKIVGCGEQHKQQQQQPPQQQQPQQNISDFHAVVSQNICELEIKTSALINTLHMAILETSEKYRQCLEMQINIYEMGEMIDENNRFWDKLIENRGEAATLKQKLQNYIDMVQYVGKTVENVILLSTVMKKDMTDVLKYFELKTLAEVESIENKNLEKKLLKATMKNIVQTKV